MKLIYMVKKYVIYCHKKTVREKSIKDHLLIDTSKIELINNILQKFVI